MKSVVRIWRDPTHHRKVKKKAYKLGEIVFLMCECAEKELLLKLQEAEDAVKDDKGWLDLNELKLLMRQQGSL